MYVTDSWYKKREYLKNYDANRDFSLNIISLKVQFIVPVGISNPLRVISHHVGSLKNNRVK